ncbi:MAG: hypothetical protein FWE78_02625 [Methanimicrococcus sp.]|nr:hypothetical protein [Methanimicrococcus sp.]
MKEEKSLWVKYGAIFAILIMLGSATIGVVMLSGFGGNSNKMKAYPFSDVSGKHTDFTFTNIKDGAKYLPEGAVQISCFRTNDTINQSLNPSFPGSEASKVLVAYYSTGVLEYYQLHTEDNVSIMINGSKPTSEDYEGYSIIYTSPFQRVIAGNPIIIVSLSNYANDSSLARRVVDAFAGLSESSKDFDPIFAYVDDVSDFEEMTVVRSRTGNGYDMLYQRSSSFTNGTLQLETVLYGPSNDLRDDIKEMAAGDSAIFTVSEDGSMIKMYIETTDILVYMMETNNLYGILYQYST